MTATLDEAPAIADPKAALRAEKRKVLAEAERLRQEHSWCQSGVSDVLERLGLNTATTVPVTATITRTLWVPVPGAIDPADALDMVREDTAHALVQAALRNQLGSSGWDISGCEVCDHDLDPQTVAKGDWDFTGGGMATSHVICENYGNSRYCTRARGHTGRHANGNGQTITATWSQK